MADMSAREQVARDVAATLDRDENARVHPWNLQALAREYILRGETIEGMRKEIQATRLAAAPKPASRYPTAIAVLRSMAGDRSVDFEIPPPRAELLAAADVLGNLIGEADEAYRNIADRNRRVATLEAELKRVVDLADAVLTTLQQYGPSIVPHLLDTDANDGQRLRDAIAAARADNTTPSTPARP